MRSNRLSKLHTLPAVLFAMLGLLLAVPLTQAANHREAPITALDHKADITDWFTFRSYEPGREDTITMILDVDPLLEPANGPNYFPFDDEIVYSMLLDNDRDAIPDIIWEFRFTTEIRAPGVFTGFVGAGGGINAPANAPLDLDGNPTAGSPVIPPAITSLDGPGAAGLSLRQSYTVRVTDGEGNEIVPETGVDADGNTLFAVPSNVGPRTMPDYDDLSRQGIFELESGARVFAGTVDDPFYIDLGGAFDSLNVPVAVLTDAQDADDTLIVGEARDDVSGFNVNVIAFEVTIGAILNDSAGGAVITDPNDPDAVIGTYGATFRPQTKTFNGPGEEPTLSDELTQIQRMGNPLINELLIGTGFKDMFSMDVPANDIQFAGADPNIPNFLLDPLAARVLNAVFGINVPNPPRVDLAPVVLYAAPICPGCGTPTLGLGEGPPADLLRVNTAIPPTAPDSASRLGALAGDFGGHPNGRRVFDDVTDIFLRVGAGVLAGGIFDDNPNNRIGDGVNRNDREYQDVFPYVAFANSGRDSRHVDRGEELDSNGTSPTPSSTPSPGTSPSPDASPTPSDDPDVPGENGGCAIAGGNIKVTQAAVNILIPLIPAAAIAFRILRKRNKKESK